MNDSAAERAASSTANSDDVDDRVARAGVDAGRSEKRGSDVACPERVAAAAVHRAEGLRMVGTLDISRDLADGVTGIADVAAVADAPAAK